MPVYEKDGVTLTLNCERQSDSGLTVTLTASNSTDSDISSFTLQAAVPKVCPTTCDEKHSVHPVNKLTSRQALFVGIDFLHNSAACGRKKCFVFYICQCCMTHRDLLPHLLSLYIWPVRVARMVSVLDPVVFSVVGISAVNNMHVFWCFKLQSSIWSPPRVSSYTWRPPVETPFLLEAQQRWHRW